MNPFTAKYAFLYTEKLYSYKKVLHCFETFSLLNRKARFDGKSNIEMM